MDISNIYAHILDPNKQLLKEKDLSNYLQTFLNGAGLQAHKQIFFYSTFNRVLVGICACVLTVLFFICVLRRRRRGAIAAALAIPAVLLFELSFHIPIVSWPSLNKGVNVLVEFPAQDACQKVIIGTQFRYAEGLSAPPSPFQAAILAFLLPVALVMLAMATWQLVMHFGGFDSEDARTIMLVMGGMCILFFFTWTAISWKTATKKNRRQILDNAESVALLCRLAEDLGKKDIRLETTSVTLSFFGGKQGEGAGVFAEELLKRQQHSVETSFIGCHELERDGNLVLASMPQEPAGTRKPQLADVAFPPAVSQARRDQFLTSGTFSVDEFAARGFPAIALTSLPAKGSTASPLESAGCDPQKLKVGLQMLEKTLLDIDAKQLRDQAPLMGT